MSTSADRVPSRFVRFLNLLMLLFVVVTCGGLLGYGTYATLWQTQLDLPKSKLLIIEYDVPGLSQFVQLSLIAFCNRLGYSTLWFTLALLLVGGTLARCTADSNIPMPIGALFGIAGGLVAAVVTVLCVYFHLLHTFDRFSRPRVSVQTILLMMVAFSFLCGWYTLQRRFDQQRHERLRRGQPPRIRNVRESTATLAGMASRNDANPARLAWNHHRP